jgi:outer membrane protein
MMNKAKSLKIMLASLAMVFAMSSCNQTVKNDNAKTNDSTQVVETPVKTVSANTETAAYNGEMKIVFIDTDSLVSRYKFFTDGNERMINLEASMRNRLESKGQKLKKEYEEYMRQGKAGLLTLKQQQDTEASLTKQQQDLGALEQRLSEDLMMKKQMLNKQINDTVANFIEAFRVEKGYTFILQKQTLNGVLSGDPALDVTEEVISRLNAKYEFETKH